MTTDIATVPGTMRRTIQTVRTVSELLALIESEPVVDAHLDVGRRLERERRHLMIGRIVTGVTIGKAFGWHCRTFHVIADGMRPATAEIILDPST